MPCGFTAGGLPVGLQIVGPRHADALVLRAARAYEAAHPQPTVAPTPRGAPDAPTRRDHARAPRVRCVARLLDEQAPRTCAALWDALPQGGDAFHGKYARNEIYTLVEDFAADARRGARTPR